MRFHKLSKYLLDAKQYDRCCFWLTYFQFPWDFSPSFQSSSSTGDFKNCLSTLLTSLQPCICGEMCLTARKGYACSRNAFFLLHKYSPRAQREKNRTTDVASNIPSQGLRWKHEVPRVKRSHAGPYLRWVEGERQEALRTCHVRTQVPPVEKDSIYSFLPPTMCFVSETNPIPPVRTGDDAGSGKSHDE